MVRAIEGNIHSQPVACWAEVPVEKGRSFPLPAPSSHSLAGRAFEQLTGSSFSKTDSPSMEYLVYQIFRETARSHPDGNTLDFLLDSLEADAPQNLQPVVNKCLELASSNPALAARLQKRLQPLESTPFQSSADLGLTEDIQETDWSGLGMLAAAALTGLLVLSALCSARPLPKPADVPCFPSDAPAPQPLSEESGPLAAANQTQPGRFQVPKKTPPPLNNATCPLALANQTESSRVELPKEAPPPAAAPAPQSNIDRFIADVGLPAGVTRAQVEQAVAAAEARHNLQKFFERNREMFVPRQETPPAPKPVPNPPAQSTMNPSLLVPAAAVAAGIGIAHLW